jgi:putative ABC transport system permease protein
MISQIIQLKEGVIIALSSIWANKLRSFLTVLGVLIGVASVIGMVSLIEGLNAAVTGEIEGLGSNLIFISRFEPDTDYDELDDEERRRKPITVGEAKAIKENCPSVKSVSPQNYIFIAGGNTVKYKDKKSKNPRIFGSWPEYMDVNQHYAENGRFFTKTENHHKTRVCVIGVDIAKGLFERIDPVGKEIIVNGTKFLVVGVMEKRKDTFDDRADNYVIMPLGIYQKLYPWEKELGLTVSAKSAKMIDQAEEEVIRALRIYRGVPYDKPNNFAIFTQERILELFKDITSTVFAVMIVISSIGLMVGGVGVLNIMLVSVTERTREIGVRKAIGARKYNIIFQFLVEAVTLSCCGGFIGIALGVLISAVASSAIKVPFSIPVYGVIAGFCVAVGVGLISGVYPAYKAAKVDPIVSLRYE